MARNFRAYLQKSLHSVWLRSDQGSGIFRRAHYHYKSAFSSKITSTLQLTMLPAGLYLVALIGCAWVTATKDLKSRPFFEMAVDEILAPNHDLERPRPPPPHALASSLPEDTLWNTLPSYPNSPNSNPVFASLSGHEAVGYKSLNHPFVTTMPASDLRDNFTPALLSPGAMGSPSTNQPSYVLPPSAYQSNSIPVSVSPQMTAANLSPTNLSNLRVPAPVSLSPHEATESRSPDQLSYASSPSSEAMENASVIHPQYVLMPSSAFQGIPVSLSPHGTIANMSPNYPSYVLMPVATSASQGNPIPVYLSPQETGATVRSPDHPSDVPTSAIVSSPTNEASGRSGLA